MKIALTAIPPAMLNQVWPRLRPGCEEVLTVANDITLPDDIYAEARAARAVVFIIKDEDTADELGFMVTKVTPDADGPALFLWVIYCKPNTLMMNGNFDAFLVELDALARAAGARRVRCYSKRGIWDYGFKLRMHIYEREV